MNTHSLTLYINTASPQNVQVSSIQTTSCQLRWSSSQDNGPEPLNYSIECYQISGRQFFHRMSSSGSPTTVLGLYPYTSYRCSVSAGNSAGTTAASHSLTFTTKAGS